MNKASSFLHSEYSICPWSWCKIKQRHREHRRPSTGHWQGEDSARSSSGLRTGTPEAVHLEGDCKCWHWGIWVGDSGDRLEELKRIHQWSPMCGWLWSVRKNESNAPTGMTGDVGWLTEMYGRWDRADLAKDICFYFLLTSVNSPQCRPCLLHNVWSDV